MNLPSTHYTSAMLLRMPARADVEPPIPSPLSSRTMLLGPANALLPPESCAPTSLWSCIGTNTTLLDAVFAIAWSASSCRICMAAGDARISAACRMRRAASTSARAAMTFDSPIRFCCAADESDAATSGEKMISLILSKHK